MIMHMCLWCSQFIKQVYVVYMKVSLLLNGKAVQFESMNRLFMFIFINDGYYDLYKKKNYFINDLNTSI